MRWFVSLTPISKKVLDWVSEEGMLDLLITAGDDLKAIIGSDMYNRINGVKEEFRNP